jgi:hypothetical protein
MSYEAMRERLEMKMKMEGCRVTSDLGLRRPRTQPDLLILAIWVQ